MYIPTLAVRRLRPASILTLILTAIVITDTADAARLSAREIQLKTLNGSACVLGHEVSLKGRRRGALRLRVNLLGKAGWRTPKNFRTPRVKHRRNAYRIVFVVPKKAVYRYELVNTQKRRMARTKPVRLSRLPLCSGMNDLFLQSLDTGEPPKTPDEGGNGGTNGSQTGTPPPVCRYEEQLRAVWGTSGPFCDLNNDNLVDATDLGILLSGWPPTPPVEKCVAVQQLLDSWGDSGPCDLDGSGTIDGEDLGRLLAGIV